MSLFLLLVVQRYNYSLRAYTKYTYFLLSQILPSLKSYSIFTAVGILFTYILQATFFVAWLSIDQRRIEARRYRTHQAYLMIKYKKLLNLFLEMECFAATVMDKTGNPINSAREASCKNYFRNSGTHFRTT